MNESIIRYSILPQEETENGRNYQIIIGLPMDFGWYDNVCFVIEKNNRLFEFPLKYQNCENGCAYFENIINLDTCAVIHYYFKCLVNGKEKYIQNGVLNDTLNIEDREKLSVNFNVPDWAKGAIMYHIFVDRYKKGRPDDLEPLKRRIIHKSWDEEMIIGPSENGLWNIDFYGGDLLGIEKTLDYIKSLGASIIYLSPIMRSQSNHRYDTADYLEVDPYAGCNEDLKTLCTKAHQKGMKVILDAVFNHTGNDSVYFNEYGTYDSVGAYQNPTSSYSDFYRKHEEHGKIKYDYWWGMTNLPVCDGQSLAWQKFITGEGGVIDHWFQLGIDGLRLDVADELSDEFIELIRIAVKRNKEDGFILGEVWKNPMHMNRGYIQNGKCLDTVMNYPLIDALIRYFKYEDVEKLRIIINEILKEYPTDTINSLMNFTSTHDISRGINIFATNDFNPFSEWAWNPSCNDLSWQNNFHLNKEEYKKGREIFESFVFTLTFLPGILSIFYGDEVGALGIGNLKNRVPYPWQYRDKSLLEFFRYMGIIRRKELFLQDAKLNVLDINPNYLMFERIGEIERLLVAINRTNNDTLVPIPDAYEDSESEIYTLKRSLKGHLTPHGGFALKKRK